MSLLWCGCAKDRVLMIQIEPVVQDPMRLLRRDGLKASHTKILRAHERACRKVWVLRG